MDLAESSVHRTLTDSECQAALSSRCPQAVEIPANFSLRGGLDRYGETASARPLEGTTVSVYRGIDIDSGFSRELAEFKKRTGINVVVNPVDFEDELATTPAEPSHRPDIYIFGRDMPEWAQQRALDVGRFVDPETLHADFGDFLLSFGTSKGEAGVRAIPFLISIKSLVYYPKREFEKAGYQVPTTWDELIALSDRMVADGRTPWCFGFESGVGTGWPGTDLIESLVLRVGGVEAYDAWTRGGLSFTSSEVTAAGHYADQLVFSPGYVRGGPAAINTEVWNGQLEHMLSRNSQTGDPEPQCWLFHQADFMLKADPAAANAQIGTDLDFFMLPPIDSTKPVPTTGGTAFAAGLNDRPEVREFMKFLASPQWGERWAVEPDNQFIAPNARFDYSNYGDVNKDPHAGVRVRLAEAARSAVQSNSFRFDASDGMPPDIGGTTADGQPGAFYRAMKNWVDGRRTIDQAFANVDSEWAALNRKRSWPPPPS
jgi:alpha-glucoside transport system substrate-binding protein